MWLMKYFAHLRAPFRYLSSPVLIALSVKPYSAQACPRLQLEPSQYPWPAGRLSTLPFSGSKMQIWQLLPS